MKPVKTSSSQLFLTDAARRLHLGRVLAESHGAGLLADHQSASSRAGWTVAQLVEMSAAKSLYN